MMVLADIELQTLLSEPDALATQPPPFNQKRLAED